MKGQGLDGRIVEQPDAMTIGRRPGRWRRAGRALRTMALIVAAAALLGALGIWLHDRFTHVYIDDARVTADVISVSSRVSGWVTRVHVVEGQKVPKGAILASIDDRDANLRLVELDARLESLDAERARLAAQRDMIRAQTSSQAEMRRSQLAAARALLAGRKSDLDMTRTDFERVKTLLTRKVVSRRRWEERRNEFLKAEQGYQQALADVAAAGAALVEAEASRARVLVLERQLAIVTHQKDELLARRAQQEIDLEDRVIRSPVDAVIDKLFVNASEYVAAGQRLLMLHDPNRIWVAANVKETDLRHVRPGAKVTVAVDAYPDEVFEARIARIGNAATSEFALLPAPNPSGNFTKIAQRLPLRIEFAHKTERLRPGMMVEVTVGIHDP